MSFFSYTTSIWNGMTHMFNNVTETISDYVNADNIQVTGVPREENPEQLNDLESEKEENAIPEVTEGNDPGVASLNDEIKEEEEDLDGFEMITDHDLYVVLYEHERGVDTEENFFIDFDESTRYH